MAELTSTADAATARRDVAAEPDFEQHRVELTGYCYRMLGSAFDAEDAVQETLVRAWRGWSRFEGRSSPRTWVYRIATNVCLDMAGSRQRRARPMDLGPSTTVAAATLVSRPEITWVEPMPDPRIMPTDGDPAELAVARETVRLAFVAALQYLPPRQRAVLILRDVLRWKAAETAQLLDTSLASVNSALQRARASLASREVGATDPVTPMDDEQRGLLERYVDAFERYDIEALIALLADDAVQSMPPYELWLQGPVEISRWLLGPGIGCRGSRLVPTVASGSAAFGQYRPSNEGGHEPWALQVVELSGGRVVAMHAFLDTDRLFPLFDLPPRLDG